MNNFFNAMTSDDALTINGAITNSTSTSYCLDLFFLIGASREKDITQILHRAFYEDKELCTRIMLYSRDIRQGMGERQHIKTFISYLEYIDEIEYVKKILNKIVELGRWDDILYVNHPELRKIVGQMTYTAILNNDALCAKWMPRLTSSKRNIANWLRKEWNVTPKQYRKLLSTVTQVVENKMCNKKWNEINYSHVPSKAMLIYNKAFDKNDSERFNNYKENLKAGKEKINAGAVYPHEVLCLARTGDNKNIALEMWKKLSNFLKEENSILPVCDVSASMGSIYTNKINPLLISVSLGLYIAQRNHGPFRNLIMTFCGNPNFYKVADINTNPNLNLEVNNLINSAPDMSTNLQGVFDLLLNKLQSGSCTHEETPKTLLIISDMEFNEVSGAQISNFDAIKEKYQLAGFYMPNIVFWNVNGRMGNIPVKMNEHGVALVSGYSPSILKNILSQNLNPYDIMTQTVMIDRYKY